MLVAFFLPGNEGVRYVLVITGFSLVAMVGALFYSKQLSPLLKVRKNIKENRELIDTVQQTAIELTKLTSVLQAFALIHAQDVAAVLQGIKPVLQRVPFLQNWADSDVLSRAETLSVTILEYSERTEKIVTDLRSAITECDPSLLRGYLSDIQQLRNRVQMQLKGQQTVEGDGAQLALGTAE